MELRGRLSVGGLVTKLALICWICMCCLSVSDPVAAGNSEGRGYVGIRSRRTKSIPEYLFPQADWRTRRETETVKELPAADRREWSRRRRLVGPGSSPPRCTSKCGRCSPCRPVHVPVPPGTPVTTEYYPEAWRCKCGNRLYMP